MMSPMEQQVWALMLPPAAHTLLTTGTPVQYLRDLYLPATHKGLAEHLSEMLARTPHRSKAEAEKFFQFFDNTFGPRPPGGTSLFDRAFRLSINVDIPAIRRMNHIIQGKPQVLSLPIQLEMRVLTELMESAYVVTWVLLGQEHKTLSKDFHAVARYCNMWQKAILMVQAEKL